MKNFLRNHKLSAALLFTLLITIVSAAYTVPFSAELGYSPPSKAEWAAANPTSDFYTSDNVPYLWAGQVLGGVHVVTYDTTTTARTIAAWETNSTFVMTSASSNDTDTFNLPAAVAGLRYTFIKTNTTASGLMKIQAATGDSINGGTASKAYDTSGTLRCSTTLQCIDGTNWEVTAQVPIGHVTWVNNNS